MEATVAKKPRNKYKAMWRAALDGRVAAEQAVHAMVANQKSRDDAAYILKADNLAANRYLRWMFAAALLEAAVIVVLLGRMH